MEREYSKGHRETLEWGHYRVTAELHGARSQMGKMDVMNTASKNCTDDTGCTEIYKLSCPNTWMYCLECSRTCIPLHKNTHTLYHPLHPIRSPQHVFQTHLTDGLPLQHSPSPISHPVVFTLNHITHFTTQHTNTQFKHSFSSNDLPQQPAIKPPTCTHNCFAQTENSTTADGSACTPAW